MAQRRRDAPLLDVIELQREACARAGSAVYDRVLAAVGADVAAGGVCAELLQPYAANALADAIPLRLLAATHALALDGTSPELAAQYPSAGGAPDETLEEIFLTTVADQRERIADAMVLGVQTNEAGRAASLLGAFHLVVQRTGLPLRCLEVGASAGLLQHWDRFGYRVGDRLVAGVDDGLVFDDPWVEAVPALASDIEVAERAGCDIAPIDVTSDAGVARLRSLLWPDQIHRRARLDAAIAVARSAPSPIEQADAGEWVCQQLLEPAPGVATVVYHSIVVQYLPRPSFELLRSSIRDAGASATPDAPVFWLRMEPAGPVASVRLWCWPGDTADGHAGTDLDLGTTGYHGPPVDWRPSQPT